MDLACLLRETARGPRADRMRPRSTVAVPVPIWTSTIRRACRVLFWTHLPAPPPHLGLLLPTPSAAGSPRDHPDVHPPGFASSHFRYFRKQPTGVGGSVKSTHAPLRSITTRTTTSKTTQSRWSSSARFGLIPAKLLSL